MNDDDGPVPRSSVWSALEKLTQGKGTQREDLFEALEGELDELRRRWQINLESHRRMNPGKELQALRETVWANLHVHIKRLNVPTRVRRVPYLYAVHLGFNMLRDRGPAELQKMDLMKRRSWLANLAPKNLRVSLSTSGRHIKNAIDQIEQQITEAGYQPAAAKSEADVPSSPVDEASSLGASGEPAANHAAATLDGHPTERSPAELNVVITEAVTDLAATVRSRTNRRLGLVTGTSRLLVRWTNADDTLADYWDRIRGNQDNTPIDLTGDLDHLWETFNRVPSGRLVVLGLPGSGKSVLALSFVFSMLADERWQPGLPVPVVFPFSSWSKKDGSLREWMVTTLLNDYPHLREPYRSSGTLAHALIDQGQILPVLDGFDEVALARRHQALRNINAYFNPGEQYLLTSRPDAYTDAADAAHEVLTSAAVVKLADLDLEVVAAYLRRATRKTAVAKWDPVLRRLGDQPADQAATRLREALTTPLMVTLACAIYSETDADPADLLNTNRFVEPYSIEDHLLEAYIEVAYKWHLDEDHQAVPTRLTTPRWSAAEARDYLGFLAVHQYSIGKKDIRWWRLSWSGSLPVLLMLVSVLYFIGNVVGLTTVIGYGGEPTPSRVIRIALASVCVAASSVVMAYFGPGLMSTAINQRERRQRRIKIVGYLVPAVILGGLLWMFFNSMGTSGWLFSTILCGVLTTWFYAMFGLEPPRRLASPSGGLKYPSQPDDIDNPAALLPVARRVAWQRAALATPLNVAGVALFASEQLSSYWPWILATCIFTPAATLFVHNMYGDWLAIRWNLALKGWLPVDALAFLEDAHARGILRQSGASYQFRHALLQAHLAVTELDRGFRYARKRSARAPLYWNLAADLIAAGRMSLAGRMLEKLQALGGRHYRADGDWSLDLRLGLAASPKRTMSVAEAEAEIRHILDVRVGRVIAWHRWTRLLTRFTFYRVKIEESLESMFEASYQLAYLLEVQGRLAEAADAYRNLLNAQQAFISNKDDPAITRTREGLWAVTGEIPVEG